MRAKAIFSVFGRRLPSGKLVYYYQCYDEKGKRQWAKSTGITKKTEATAYCMKLFRDGLLIPEQKAPTFAEFSDGWWNAETCRFLKWRQMRKPISKGTILFHQKNFENHIKDYFAKYRLDEITPNTIEGWLLHLSEKKVNEKNAKDVINGNDETRKKLKPKTINLMYVTLKIMIGEAVRTGLLKSNPCKEIKKLSAEEIVRDILSVEEAKKLFPFDWSTVWSNKVIFNAHRMAACTGLRIGELLGLRGEYVFDDYIYITGQYSQRFGYIPHTKTKHNRNIPIPTLMRQELDGLLKANGNGFVFSENGGKTPVATCRINREFDRALQNIGISHDERIKRNLSFHAWRHFLNTLLLMRDVGEKKVQAVTGHLTRGMTDHYTHFDTRKFTKIRDVQADLLTSIQPEEATA